MFYHQFYSPTPITDWLQAIGTFLAIFVALFTTLYFELWKPFREKPKLEIFYDDDDPQCRRMSPAPQGQASSIFARLKIANNGKTTAERCIVRLVEVADERGNVRNDWWDVSSLAWSGQNMPEPISLSPIGDYFFADILQIVENDSSLRLRVDRTPRAIKLDLEPGQYYFKLVVYADKAEPVEQWFELNWFGEFNKFTMRKVRKPG